MRRIVLQTSLVFLTLLFFGACSTKRKGCGLTSDAKKIEAQTALENNTIISAE